jgi:hypothetical protein
MTKYGKKEVYVCKQTKAKYVSIYETRAKRKKDREKKHNIDNLRIR